MRGWAHCGLAIAIGWTTAGIAAGQAPAGKAAARAAGQANISPRPTTDDEKAVRTSAAAFATAYNAHDAKAIAALFAPEGELVDESGNVEQGRPRIEAVFQRVFDEFPEATLSLSISTIRFLGPQVAEEEGTTRVVHVPGGSEETGRYLVLHLKQDGKWLMASARDLSEAGAEPASKLEPLAGLIGDWIDESPAALVVSSYRWSEDRNYILGRFEIKITGQPVMSGSQRIGWDPLARTIRSWIFNSDGGFAQGAYSQDGPDRWVIKLTGVTRDGQASSATNLLSILGKDRMAWQSRDRTVGGIAEADTPQVFIVRPPPGPQ